MNKITHETWKVLVQAANEQIIEHPYLRFGQSLFNITHDLYPELANSVVGTNNDPFHTGKDENSLSVCLFYDKIVK
jgi:hypothetical protein